MIPTSLPDLLNPSGPLEKSKSPSFRNPYFINPEKFRKSCLVITVYGGEVSICKIDRNRPLFLPTFPYLPGAVVKTLDRGFWAPKCWRYNKNIHFLNNLTNPVNLLIKKTYQKKNVEVFWPRFRPIDLKIWIHWLFLTGNPIFYPQDVIFESRPSCLWKAYPKNICFS